MFEVLIEHDLISFAWKTNEWKMSSRWGLNQRDMTMKQQGCKEQVIDIYNNQKHWGWRAGRAVAVEWQSKTDRDWDMKLNPLYRVLVLKGVKLNPMKDLASSVRVLTAEVQASQEQARTAPPWSWLL